MALLPICVIAAAPAGAQDEPISETITVTGRGWGHGRGFGHWGPYGYATGRSGGPWTYLTILDHCYRDTALSSIANPLAAVTLLEQRGRPLMVGRAAGVTIDGLDDPSDPDLLDEVSTAVRVTMRPDGRYEVERSTSCTDGVWSPPVVVNHPVRLRAAGTTGERDDVLRLCHDDGTSTGYRGELVAMSRTFDGRDVGLAQTVNLVRLDDLLRSVLPGQLPPSWASRSEEHTSELQSLMRI